MERLIACDEMDITNPVDAIDNPIVRFEVFGIDCQVATDLATVSILKRCHPILAITHDLTHFPRLNLMYVRQLLCSLHKLILPLPLMFVSLSQTAHCGDLTNRSRFSHTPVPMTDHLTFRFGFTTPVFLFTE